jgi:hypothetical protein
VGDLDDPVLGHLKWYGDREGWVAEVDFHPDHPIEVIIEFHDERDQSTLLSQAHQWVARVRRREPEYRAWSAKHLSTSRWNKEEPMTVEDIQGLLCLLSIVCAPDGTAELFWDDDDALFFGHNIGTQLAINGECVAVEMM